MTSSDVDTAASTGNAPEHRVTFARGLGLFDATMIGVGAMIGAGIFVLTGLAAGVAGPAAILAFLLNGGVTLLTAFSYAELASAIPEAGGGYSYIKKAFPPWIGFLSGWMLWFAYTVACALYALGFGSYFWEFFHKYTPDFSRTLQTALTFWPDSHIAVVTLSVGIVLLALNYRGAEVTGKAENVLTVSKLVILSVFIGFGLWQAVHHPEMVKASFTPFFAQGAGGVIVAMGLTFIAFEGYDLIATVSEEVREPESNIPRAIFIALGITILVYLLIIFVALAALPSEGGRASWQLLGDKGETAIVEAAKAFMPSFGVAVIVFGGLLSTMSALNATIMASSRVAFSMGRDRMLPDALARIHPKSRTPYIAIVVTGVILLGLAVSFDVAVVGSAASVMFLLTFTLVNLSVLVLRSDRTVKRRYTIPLYPWPPLLGAVTSVFLAVYQVNLGPEGLRSWAVSLAWIVLGLAVYLAFFREQVHEQLPKILDPASKVAVAPPPTVDYRVLVPVYNPKNVDLLVGIACRLARRQGERVEVVVVSIVEVPYQLKISEGLKFVPEREAVLAKAEAVGRVHGTPLRTEIRVAHNTADAVLNMARSEGANMLIVGWRGGPRRKDSVFGSVVDRIIDHAPCDLMVVKFDPDIRLPLKQILLPTAGGPNARFVARMVEPLIAEDGTITVAGVVKEGGGEAAEARARKGVADTLAELSFDIDGARKLLHGRKVPEAIVEEGSHGPYDAVFIGAAGVDLFKRAMFGRIPEQTARDCAKPVILVKHYEGAKSWLNRFLGR